MIRVCVILHNFEKQKVTLFRPVRFTPVDKQEIVPTFFSSLPSLYYKVLSCSLPILLPFVRKKASKA